MTDYELGYRQRVNNHPAVRKTVEDHYSGKQNCNLSGEWFTGWNDADDDIKFTRMGCDQMQFDLTA